MKRTALELEFENAVVHLVGCIHPLDARSVPNICVDCGSLSRDGGHTWTAPVLVQVLADATNALGTERAGAGHSMNAQRRS
jgi:hypothetical protein